MLVHCLKSLPTFLTWMTKFLQAANPMQIPWIIVCTGIYCRDIYKWSDRAVLVRWGPSAATNHTTNLTPAYPYSL